MGIRVGLIGAGNMAQAIYSGAIAAGVLTPQNIYLYDVDKQKMRDAVDRFSVNACENLDALLAAADLFILTVKPHIAPQVLPKLRPGCACISIVAGLDSAKISSLVPQDVRILRVMPNTPLMVGKGATVFAQPNTLLQDEYDFAFLLFSALGVVEAVEERLMSAATGLNGSGPAYVYMFIEALADAGVKHGLTRACALNLAAQTVLGSAQMVLCTDTHPAALKDAVCSPGGTTIEAVASLERDRFRSAVIRAVDAAVEKAQEL